jgi:peptidoglycan/xylan/chitin deacetylase (PgdA/CDA1 family)
MGKKTTWVTCGAVAAGIVGTGALFDWALGTWPILTGVGAALGLVYLVGTFGASTPIFGRVARAHSDGKTFSLTFDDGPDPRHTPAISKLLAERGHKATFFVLARQLREHPAVAAQVAADGHELANHGDDHRILAFSLPGTIRAQLAAAEEAARAATGGELAPLFRASHGYRSPWLGSVVRRLGYKLCGWDGRIFDSALPGAETIAERATGVLRPGAVLLLHDGDGSGRGRPRQQTVDALPAILDEADRRGLRSVRLSELLR